MKFGKSLTQQHFRDQCNINNIVRRAQNAGRLPEAGGNPQYLDVSNIPDFQSAQNAVISAYNLFNQLNSKIRTRFDNDPGKMLAFVKDPVNLDEAIKLGIVTATHRKAENKPSDEQRNEVQQESEKKVKPSKKPDLKKADQSED